MGFYDVIEKWKDFDFEGYFSHVTDEDVIESIYKEKPTEYDLLNLLSPTAKIILKKWQEELKKSKLNILVI